MQILGRQVLMSHVDDDNVVALLTAADVYQSPLMRDRCLLHIIRNFDSLDLEGLPGVVVGLPRTAPPDFSLSPCGVLCMYCVLCTVLPSLCTVSSVLCADCFVESSLSPAFSSHALPQHSSLTTRSAR